MCTIDKILIKGIRSFSTDNPTVLEFYKPLTLIVGHNGAGKTTIIECLKQVCTGELPPNTRAGQNFIHDPKIAGEMEVKAQIKLRINTANGQPVVVIRSFQLTQKKLQLQFKAIDQVVQTFNKETGQKEALSYRCQDMDRVVPTLMGVSKAILENVIFVHQEDSNWPLSEGQVLKRKFDDIFAATKYTKALEALRKLRLEKVAELREFKLRLDHLKTHKDAAQRLRTEVSTGKTRQESLQKQIDELDVEIRAQEEAVAELNVHLQAFMELGRSLSEQRALHNSAIARNAERKVQLAAAYGEDELEYTQQELEEWHTSMAPRLQEMSKAVDTLAQDILAAENREDTLKRQLAQEQNREAQLAAQADAHKSNISERDQALSSAAAQAGLDPLPNSDLSPGVVRNFMDALTKKLQDEEEKLKQQRAKNQQQDDEGSNMVDEVTRQITDASQMARIRQQTMRENEGKVNQLQHQVESQGVSPVVAQEAAEAEAVAQQRFEQRQEALAQQNFAQELDAVRSDVDAIQSKISTLRQERDRLSVAADDGARLTVLRRERTQKQSRADTIMENRRQQISNLLDCPPDSMPSPSSLKSTVEKLISDGSRQLQEKSSALQRAQSKASSTQGALTACTQLLGQQQAEADALRAKISSTLARLNEESAEDKQLDEITNNEEAQIISKRQKVERVKTLKINSKVWGDVARKQNRCELCQRPFSGDEREQFLQLLESKLANVPSLIEGMKAQIESQERKLSELRQLQPEWVRLNQLQTSVIKGTTDEQNRLETQSTSEASKASNLHEEVQKLKAREQELQDLRTEVVWPVDRLYTEIAQLSKEIVRLENQMKISGSTRTVAGVDTDLESLESERGSKERLRDEILRKQSRLRDEVSQLQTSWYAAKEEAATLRAAADKQARLSQEITALKQSNEQLKQQIDSANRSIAPLRAKRDQLTRARQEKRDAARERESEIESKFRELFTLQSKLQDKCRVVSSYETSNKADTLQRVRQSLQKVVETIANEASTLKDKRAQREEQERELSNDTSNKRQIEDLINFRKALAEQDALAQKIEELQGQMVGVGSMDDINLTFEQKQKHIKGLQRDQNIAQGSIATVKESVQKSQADLSGAQYREIDIRYRKQLLESKTTEIAVADLEKYHKALEKALLLFHTNKMADINKIIKELWQKTYRGQDIDYIQMKADADGARSYNYRVVMHAGGAELDMRGRCSAGQKVLACLIIRLALAETFCLNCGILALDEPTTNLDSANSASLAEALRNIMETRRSQDNFQLVVITHDESFAHLIGTREHAMYKWRITKDDNQHSHISQEGIDE